MARERARKEEDVKAAAAAFMDGGLTVTEAADLWGANVADVQAEITRIRAARR
jgi:hypothetical protein